MTPLPRSALACALLILAACRSPAPTPIDQPTPEGDRIDWFCQMGDDEGLWDCVKQTDSSATPRPRRVPRPPKPETATPDPATTLAPSPRQAPPIQPPTSEWPRNVNNLPETAPLYQRLAFQPETPTRIIELPGDFFTVQLLAVSSKEALEKYVRNENLRGLTAARVERNGALYYVLLLGIYEDRLSAESAAANIPGPIAHLTPWVRNLGSLQEAMLRGDTLAGTPEV